MPLQLEYERLYGIPDALILMTHPKAGTFGGVKMEDFSLSSSSDYTAPFEGFGQDRDTKIQAAATVVNSLTGANITLPRLSNRAQSAVFWTNSGRVQIPVNFMILRKRSSDPSATSISSKLYSVNFPSSGENASGVDAGQGYNYKGSFTAPLDFKPLGDDSGQYWNVRVGTYFKADQLVLQSVAVTDSKEVTSDGSPLFVNVQCTLETIAVPTAEIVQSWWLK